MHPQQDIDKYNHLIKEAKNSNTAYKEDYIKVLKHLLYNATKRLAQFRKNRIISIIK
jgi:hypothetical protein